MSRLFVYGDSYAAPRGSWGFTEGYDFKTYYELLGELLHCTSVSVYGMQGASNTWIIDRLVNTCDSHTQEDYCVIILTDQNRRWFWHDKPQLSNYMQLEDFDRFLTPEEIDAVKKYYLYLNDSKICQIEFEQSARVAMAASRADTRVIGGFNHITGQLSNLTVQSVKEYQGGLAAMNQDYQLRGQGFDPRLNHFSEVNHQRLAELIHTWFLHPATVLDLTQLHENIIPDK